MNTSTPSVVIAANVRPGFTGSASTPPWPKIHGFSINTISCPASGEYTLQPTSPNGINSIRYFIDLPFQIKLQVAEGTGRCSKVSSLSTDGLCEAPHLTEDAVPTAGVDAFREGARQALLDALERRSR